MRRLMFLVLGAGMAVSLAACGNKGPLYRPAVQAATPQPAPAISAPAPARSG